jgi:hypothetical protein
MFLYKKITLTRTLVKDLFYKCGLEIGKENLKKRFDSVLWYRT